MAFNPEETAVKVVHHEDRPPTYERGDHPGWTLRMIPFLLGRHVAREIFEFNPDTSKNVMVDIAADLAAQEPPLSIAESWTFYDGVKTEIEDHRAAAKLLAEHEEGAKV